MEMFKLAAGIRLTHVPYKGAGPAVTDLLAGNVHAAFMVPGNVQQFVKDGKLKLLATTGEKRFVGHPRCADPCRARLQGIGSDWDGWVFSPRREPRAPLSSATAGNS
jgi:tripartite-type tricarboxylate transporter receptor subunit TctC